MLMKKTYIGPKLNRYGTVEKLTQSYSSFYGKGKGKGKGNPGKGGRRGRLPNNGFS